MRWVVGLVIATIASHVAAADPPARYPFRGYGTERGLGNLAINQIAQTNDGLLWVATEDGLYSYDGEQFYRVDLLGAVHTNFVFTVLPTMRGLWVGTAKGLVRLGADRETLDVARGLPAERVHALAEAPDGTLWVATEVGLFHEVGGAFVLTSGWPGGGSWAVMVGRDGSVVAGRGADAVVRVGENDWRVLGEAEGFGRDRIDQFATTLDGTVWVRSARFLWACGPQLAGCRDETRMLPDASEVGRMLVDQHGGLWVTTRRGLAHRLADSQWTLLDSEHGLPVRSVINAFEDRDGSLWIVGDQLYQLLGRGRWSSYSAQSGFPADTVWAELRDAAGTLWVGCNRGLLRAVGDAWVVYPGTEPYTIRSVVEAGSVLYAAGSGVVLRIDLAISAAEAIGLPGDLRGDEISSLLYDHGTLWMGMLDGGLIAMSEDGGHRTWRRETVTGGHAREDVNQVILDRRGRLWIAGSDGLAVRSAGTWRRYTTRDGLAATSVAYVVERASGELCVGYSEEFGVSCFQVGGDMRLSAVRQLTRSTGLISDKVYLLGEDSARRLYVGTGVGVDIIDGARTEHVSTDSGLIGDDCASGAFWADPGGDVMIGSTRGLSRFQAAQPPQPVPTMIPLVMGFSLDGRRQPIAGVATAPGTGSSSLSVQFAAPWFGNRSRLEHQTRLLPLETEWRTTTMSEARYPALDHGAYTFEVRARLASGSFGDTARIAFRIGPSWWQTAWFRGSLTLALLLLAALVFRWRVRVNSARASARVAARSEASFRKMIEQCPDAMFVHRGGRILYANSQTVAFLGYTDASELVGTSVFDRVHPEDHAGVRERVASLITSGAPNPAREVRMVRRDGAVVIAEVAALRVEFEGAHAVLAIARDHTERKALEARLMFADRMASIGTMAAGLAHEVNNPLAYLKANLALIDEELASGASPELREALADAREGADRVDNIVKGVKVFSRADGDQRAPIDIERALELALRMTANELRHRCRIVKDYGPVPAVLGNDSRLGQVFMNLLVNAAHAMAGGSAETNELRIATHTDAAGSAVIEIRDTGCGMSPEVCRRVFEPFYTTKDVGEGTGLGLAVCHGIVESLGGTISVTSTPGVGTTFRVVLPGTTCVQPAAALRSSPVVVVSTSRSVLVVDDDDKLLASIGRMLRKEHRVTLATSAADALVRVEAGETFDIIVCDLMMPGFTGMALHAELEQRFPGQAARMLFMTGGAFTAEARDFLDRPAVRYLEKPFDAAELRRRVQSVSETRTETIATRH